MNRFLHRLFNVFFFVRAGREISERVKGIEREREREWGRVTNSLLLLERERQYCILSISLSLSIHLPSILHIFKLTYTHKLDGVRDGMDGMIMCVGFSGLISDCEHDL